MLRMVLIASLMTAASTHAFAQADTPGTAPGAVHEKLPDIIDANNSSNSRSQPTSPAGQADIGGFLTNRQGTAQPQVEGDGLFSDGIGSDDDTLRPRAVR